MYPETVVIIIGLGVALIGSLLVVLPPIRHWLRRAAKRRLWIKIIGLSLGLSTFFAVTAYMGQVYASRSACVPSFFLASTDGAVIQGTLPTGGEDSYTIVETQMPANTPNTDALAGSATYTMEVPIGSQENTTFSSVSVGGRACADLDTTQKLEVWLRSILPPSLREHCIIGTDEVCNQVRYLGAFRPMNINDTWNDYWLMLLMSMLSGGIVTLTISYLTRPDGRKRKPHVD